MVESRNEQYAILTKLLQDERLLGSAKNQIRIFLDMLRDDRTIGFDTTSALFYGFLNNPEFIDQSGCALSREKLENARALFRERARIGRAQESSLLKKVARLPLAAVWDGDMDLKDLAVSMLTYASETNHFTYNPEIVNPLYEYLHIPKKFFLNVYDLYYDLQSLGIDYQDFIINLSRLRIELLPPTIKSISIAYEKLFDKVFPRLPGSLCKLNGSQLEDFIMDCYAKAGFTVVRIGQRTTTPDGGVDIIAQTTPSGLIGELKLAIQCKATKKKVGVDLIRGFNTSLQNYAVHKGVFVAKSGFTKDTYDEVNLEKYPIELMDYVKLTNKLRRLVQRK